MLMTMFAHGATWRRGVAALWILGVLGSPAMGAPAAWAQPAEPDRTPLDGVPEASADKAQKFQASEYHKAGTEAWRSNRFSEALRLFRKAYGFVRRAETRLMIARTLDAQGRSAEAYEEAVAAAAEAAPPIDAQAKQLVEALSEKIGLVTVQVSGDAEQTAIVVNGKPLDSQVWGRPFAIAPGSVQVVATNTAGEVTESIEIAAGESKVVAIAAPGEPQKASAPVAPVAPPAPVASMQEAGGASWFLENRFTIGIVTAAAGGVFLINFGIFGLLSNGQAERLANACPDPNDCDPSLAEEADKGQRFQTVANVMAGLSAVTLAAGAGLIVWDLVDPADDDTVAARPRLVVGPGSVSIEGSF